MATLKDEKVIDQWYSLIEDSAGSGDWILDKVEKNLAEFQAPGVRWRKEPVQTGLIKGLLGKKRELLLVTNDALKDHKMYVGARDYGKGLSVSWFLTTEPGYFKKKFSAALTGNEKALSFALDLFDQEELRAYVTVSHHAVLEAVQALMEHRGQDFSKVNTTSKGFLEVW